VVTLLDKPSRRRCSIEVAYVGREIEDRFVIGFGLDFDERYRNLPEIWEFEPDREE
jgi:hypoxanthine phosphoribosyltransferase